MKTFLFLIMLVFTGMQALGQSTRSVSYTYFHSTVIADQRNGQDCAPGSPNCVGGGLTFSAPVTTCGTTKSVQTYSNGNYLRYHTSADVGLSTLQKLNYKLVNKTQGNKVVYDFDIERDLVLGWVNGDNTISVDVNPSSDFTFGTYSQDVTTTININDGSIKITTPSIPMLAVASSDVLEQTITPTLISTCTTATSVPNLFDPSAVEYTSTGCITTSPIVQTIPGVVANNGQTSANGAMLYDVKFSSESADKGGWYLLDGRLLSSITNSSAREAAVMKFGTGATTRLPDTRDKYSVASNAATAPFTSSGAATTTITANNLPALSGSTTTDGSHSHNLDTRYNDDFNNNGGGYTNTQNFSAPQNDTGNNNLSWTNMISGGGHGHSVTVNSASPNTPISIIPPTISLYQFIYLGE